MKSTLITFFFLLTLRLTSQVDTLTVVQDHTILEFKCTGSKCKYFVDKRLVTRAEYEKHKNEPSVATCKPCYLRQMNNKGNLMYEGDFYTDCCIGIYIKRFANGKIKVKGQYRIPATKIPDFNKGDCRPDGEWKYYKENGDIEKIETYKNGELVK